MKKVPLILVVILSFSSCLNFEGYLLNRPDAEPEFGTFIDSRDNYEYATVTINDQTWMAENLRYLPAVSPLAEGSTTVKHYYVYDYNGSDVETAIASSNYVVYGALYNWEAAIMACPTGWHLPADDEWKTLEFVLGMQPVEAENLEWRDSGEVGKKLKSIAMWQADLGGDNSSGFNALPAGNRNAVPDFDQMSQFADFWTTTTDGSDKAFFRAVRYAMDGVYRTSFTREAGFSIRCMKDLP